MSVMVTKYTIQISCVIKLKGTALFGENMSNSQKYGQFKMSYILLQKHEIKGTTCPVPSSNGHQCSSSVTPVCLFFM